MRDVQDEDRRGQNGHDPNEARICGATHEDSCTNKLCAKTLRPALHFPRSGPKMINLFLRKERPRVVSRIRDSFMLLLFSKRISPSAMASSQIERWGQLRRHASASE